jgi:hypothetical protein
MINDDVTCCLSCSNEYRVLKKMLEFLLKCNKKKIVSKKNNGNAQHIFQLFSHAEV